MKSNGVHLDQYRTVHPSLGGSPSHSGFFVIPRESGDLRILSSGEHHKSENGIGEWEHVSVSLDDRCPTCDEMCIVKDLFWNDGECVIQFHPPKSEYINNMPYCLHLWRYVKPFPLPPSIAVGIAAKHKRAIFKERLRRLYK